MTAGAKPRYSLGEEIANSVTHGIGAVLAVGGLVTVVALAAAHGTARHVVGCGVFGATLVLLYSASALYHGIPGKRVVGVPAVPVPVPVPEIQRQQQQSGAATGNSEQGQ